MLPDIATDITDNGWVLENFNIFVNFSVFREAGPAVRQWNSIFLVHRGCANGRPSAVHQTKRPP